MMIEHMENGDAIVLEQTVLPIENVGMTEVLNLYNMKYKGTHSNSGLEEFDILDQSIYRVDDITRATDAFKERVRYSTNDTEITLPNDE